MSQNVYMTVGHPVYPQLRNTMFIIIHLVESNNRLISPPQFYGFMFFAKKNDELLIFLNGPLYGLVPKLCEVHGKPADGGPDTAERGQEGEPEEEEEGPESKTVRSTETTGRACLTRRTQGIL